MNSQKWRNPQVQLAAAETLLMPPQDEWDFRPIVAEECRFACLWEFMRSHRTVETSVAANVVRWVKGEQGQGGMGAALKTANYLCARAGDLKLPYVTIDKIVYKKLAADDFINLPALVQKLKQGADPVSKFLWNNLRAATKELLSAGKTNRPCAVAQAALIEDLNRILSTDSVYDEARFAGVPLTTITRLMHEKPPLEELERWNPQPKETLRYNRWLLEESYPAEIARNRKLEPLDWRSFYPFGRATLVLSMARIREQMKERIREEHDPLEVIDLGLGKRHYALSVNFTRGGLEKIKAELAAWVDREAKLFPPARRGKGAEPPYDCLRWLATYRLELARQKSGHSFEAVQTQLREYQRKRALPGAPMVLPVYESHGAWSKAKGQAIGLLERLESDPVAFEKKILF